MFPSNASLTSRPIFVLSSTDHARFVNTLLQLSKYLYLSFLRDMFDQVDQVDLIKIANILGICYTTSILKRINILSGEIIDHSFASFARILSQVVYTAKTARCTRIGMSVSGFRCWRFDSLGSGGASGGGVNDGDGDCCRIRPRRLTTAPASVAGAQEGLVSPSLEWVFRLVCWCNAAKCPKFRFLIL